MLQILVADDDNHIRQLITLYLEQAGFKVIQASNGRDAWGKLEEYKINLAIVDIMMPYKDGWELTEEIKEFFDIPVLMVTARGESQDKLKGFKKGTDDYLVKPFDPLEMVARVKALLKRYQIEASDILYISHTRLDRKRLQISFENEQMTLPPKEFELLFTLGSVAGKIFTREQLIHQLWGYDYEGDERTVDVHIKRLRERFSKKDTGFEIKTIRGLGYKLVSLSQ
ncbi:response regulator transcription factor [Cytobacillus sp. IB215665]|uniref:response regulator transcription factor n=1 Tax=Cytobacillus sp. IB215665 TaxID=3097357 RepID=UPI002A128E69|nr:response regulator transcription factor [Cytobacillus sp. IB215665]MDX8366299.1 response regulator transcription factor [Cytobacillus sp. IB215665]